MRRAASPLAADRRRTSSGISPATFIDDAPVVDGNLVSVRDWSEHPQLVEAFIGLLLRTAPVS
ncbi:hypothetical protein [Nocardia mexicana]|uniref:hypothetical protein n=1 Tax=Nocardia mexicana TaxID=279262 RepID=UPI000A730BC9|nr:hypothetical protein [Nocardia mexicana]